MKRWRIIVSMLALLLCATNLWAGITFVQQTTQRAKATSMSFPAQTPVAGNLLIIVLGSNTTLAAATFSVTDTQTNVWTKANDFWSSAQATVFWATANSNSANTVSITATAGGGGVFKAMAGDLSEWNSTTGWASSPVDLAPTGNASTPPDTGVSGTSAQATELVIGMFGESNVATIATGPTADAGTTGTWTGLTFVQTTGASGGSNASCGSASNLPTTTGTFGVNWVLSTSTFGGTTVLASFKASTAAAVSAPLHVGDFAVFR